MGKGYVDGAGDNQPNIKAKHNACSIRHRTFYFLGFSKFAQPEDQNKYSEKNP
jgi:hypothetical protein